MLHVLVDLSACVVIIRAEFIISKVGKVKQMNGPPLATKVDQLGKVGNVWPLQVLSTRATRRVWSELGQTDYQPAPISSRK